MATYKLLVPSFFFFFLFLTSSLAVPTLAASISQQINNFTIQFEQSMMRQEMAQLLVDFNSDFFSGKLLGTASCLKEEGVWFKSCYSRYPLAYTVDATTLNHTISDIDLETFCVSFNKYANCLEKFACEKCPSSSSSAFVPCHLQWSSKWNVCHNPMLIKGKWYVNFLAVILIAAPIGLFLFVFFCVCGLKFPWRCFCRCGRGRTGRQAKDTFEDEASHSDLE